MSSLQNWLTTHRLWGKFIGALIGFAIRGPVGALIGGIIGHQFDRGFFDGMKKAAGAAPGVGQLFFETTFSVMGHVAKADGRVSESEIQLARVTMQRFDLSEDKKREAIRLFTEGKSADFPLDDVIERFRRACIGRDRLVFQFVEIQVDAMLADRRAHPQTRQLLWHICERLGIDRVDLAQMEAAAHARRTGFSQEGGVLAAYKVLGVEPEADDRAVKTAYRRLMSRHHPDKLAAKGLPAEMMNQARAQTQAIQAAYEMVKASRGLR